MRAFTRTRRQEALEQAADVLAMQALSSNVTTTVGAGLRAGHLLSPAGLSVPHGQPLEAPLKNDLQRRFEHDFSQVRVHVDDPLSQTARALGSRAIAVGSHVAFAPGEFRPREADGRLLLAHELAHVVQVDRGLTPARLFSQKAVTAAPFYRAELEDLKTARGNAARTLRIFVAFCEAVDQELVGELGQRLDAVRKVDVGDWPFDFPHPSTIAQLLVRLTLLDQHVLARDLRRWQASLQGPGPGNRPYFDSAIRTWEETLDGLRPRVNWKDAGESLRLLESMSGFLGEVIGERDGLDRNAVRRDVERLRPPRPPYADLDEGNLTSRMAGRAPFVSIARYHARLDDLAVNTFAAIQAPYQAVLEGATEQLRAGKPPRLLTALEALLRQRLIPLVRAVDYRAIGVNETRYVPAGQTAQLWQVDAFLGEKEAMTRSVRLESYDRSTTTPPSAPTQPLWAPRILAIRADQIDALKRIYGLERAPDGSLSADALENRKALQAMGGAGLRLHNDDDWRAYLLHKFTGHLASSGSAAEALDVVIALLRVYLEAFTIHTPMNIADFGDNLLTRTFPRALTGELVHDCGVYALRIAYMLSLLRDHPKLRLRFRWIQLPVHIGLIITGDGLPAYLVHNDKFVKHEVEELKALRAKWDAIDATGAKRAQPRHSSADDDQFLGELSTEEFVTGTDVPFRIGDIPRTAGQDSVRSRVTIWQAYKTFITPDLFGAPTRSPSDPAYQFHLRYLELLEAIKEHHNLHVVPFWNDTAHPSWRVWRDRIAAAHATIATARREFERRNAWQRFDGAVSRYRRGPTPDAQGALEPRFLKVKEAYHPINDKASAIMNDLQQRPKIVAPGVPRSSGERLRELFGRYPRWAFDIDEHLGALKLRQLDSPPFAEPSDKLPLID